MEGAAAGRGRAGDQPAQHLDRGRDVDAALRSVAPRERFELLRQNRVLARELLLRPALAVPRPAVELGHDALDRAPVAQQVGGEPAALVDRDEPLREVGEECELVVFEVGPAQPRGSSDRERGAQDA